jgi:hypothetical protein
MIAHSSSPLFALRASAAGRPLSAFQRPVDRTPTLWSHPIGTTITHRAVSTAITHRPTEIAITHRAASVSRDCLPVKLEPLAKRAHALAGRARGLDR